MFKKQSDLGGDKNVETIIGLSVKVKGEFYGQGSIVVEGMFEGNLKTQSDLFVGEKAKIIADIEAKNAKIAGEITGNVKIKGSLDLANTAKIIGDVEAGNISVAPGAILNGKCTMNIANGEDKDNKKK